METRHYYVAPSMLRPGTNSLWRFTVPGTARRRKSPRASTGCSITYGIDGGAAAGQQNVDHYAAADGVRAWDKVVAVRLQMLVATAKDGVARNTQSVDFAGSTVAVHRPPPAHRAVRSRHRAERRAMKTRARARSLAARASAGSRSSPRWC